MITNARRIVKSDLRNSIRTRIVGVSYPLKQH